jgi:hypothetical protein
MPQEASNLLVIGKCQWHFSTCHCMFLHNLLNVLVQTANKMGLQKKIPTALVVHKQNAES